MSQAPNASSSTHGHGCPVAVRPPHSQLFRTQTAFCAQSALLQLVAPTSSTPSMYDDTASLHRDRRADGRLTFCGRCPRGARKHAESSAPLVVVVGESGTCSGTRSVLPTICPRAGNIRSQRSGILDAHFSAPDTCWLDQDLKHLRLASLPMRRRATRGPARHLPMRLPSARDSARAATKVGGGGARRGWRCRWCCCRGRPP